MPGNRRSVFAGRLCRFCVVNYGYLFQSNFQSSWFRTIVFKVCTLFTINGRHAPLELLPALHCGWTSWVAHASAKQDSMFRLLRFFHHWDLSWVLTEIRTAHWIRCSDSHPRLSLISYARRYSSQQFLHINASLKLNKFWWLCEPHGNGMGDLDSYFVHQTCWREDQTLRLRRAQSMCSSHGTAQLIKEKHFRIAFKVSPHLDHQLATNQS